MPRLDSQGRLTLPHELREELSWWTPHKVLALCYDFTENAITICDKHLVDDKCVVAYRKTDSKNRIFFPKDALDTIGATKNDLLIVYLRKGQIYIKKSFF